MWDIDSALRGAKDQRYRIDRATGRALTMADTARGVEQGWAIFDQAEDIAFWAGLDAGAATQTDGRVHDGMQRRWLVEPGGF